MNSIELRAQTEPGREPARSRMIDNFVSDLMQLLSHERWSDAHRHASLVPMIAVALSDKALSFSTEAYEAWCRRWVKGESDAAIGECCARAVSTDAAEEGVPRTALLWLRLRRHVRPVTSEQPYAPNMQNTIAGSPSIGPTCVALANAMRQWYLQAGRRDAVVQLNLSRLMVHH